MHAEVRIGNSLIMMNDGMGGAKGPQSAGRLTGVALGLRRGLRHAVQARGGGGRTRRARPDG